MSVSGARGDGAADKGGAIVLLACVDTATPPVFPDEVLCSCAICGASIHHRPDALDGLPQGARAACLPCAARYAREHDRPGRMATHGITRQTLVDATHYLSEHTR